MRDYRFGAVWRRPSPGRAIGALAATLVIMVGVAGCGGGDEQGTGQGAGQGAGQGEGGLTTVRVGILPSTASAPLILGIEKGYFRDVGLDVETQLGKGGAALIPAMVSGQFQFSFSNNVSLIVALSKGLPVRIVAMADAAGEDPQPSPEALIVSNESGISSLQDLAGKTIASNTLNNIVQLAVMYTLDEAGVDPNSVQFVEVGFPNMPLALQEGEVDAVDIVTPFLEEAMANGAVDLAHAYRVLEPNLYVSSWFTTQNYIQDKPELVAAFEEAMDKSNAYAEEHPDEVREIVPTYLEISEQTAQDMTLYHWAPDRPSQELLQRLAELSVRYGFIDEAPDVSQLLPDLKG